MFGDVCLCACAITLLLLFTRGGRRRRRGEEKKAKGEKQVFKLFVRLAVAAAVDKKKSEVKSTADADAVRVVKATTIFHDTVEYGALMSSSALVKTQVITFPPPPSPSSDSPPTATATTSLTVCTHTQREKKKKKKKIAIGLV